MTEIYLHIVARMADYMDTHPYAKQKYEALPSTSHAGVSGVPILSTDADPISVGNGQQHHLSSGVPLTRRPRDRGGTLV